MSTFVASKFDPESDPSRPQIGELIELDDDERTPDVQKGKYRIEKVDWVESSRLMRDFMDHVSEQESVMASQGFDKCLANHHPTRPGVTWLVWVNKVEG